MIYHETLIHHNHGGPGWDLSHSSICHGCAITRRPRLQRQYWLLTHAISKAHGELQHNQMRSKQMEYLETLIPHQNRGPGWDISDSSIYSWCAITRRPRIQRPFYGRIHKKRFPRHMASCKTTKCVQSRWSASKPSSAITMEVPDGIYLTLPSVLGALLLGDPVSNGHFIAAFTKGGFQDTWRAATRPNAFIADGMPRNPHPAPPWRSWMGFI